MQRMLLVAAVALALSAVAFGQTGGRRVTLSKSELELVALSREFVDTSVGKGIVVSTDRVVMTPTGPMGVAEERGKWESVELDDLDAAIDGERAVVTGRVVFKGRSPEGKAIDTSSKVRIVYAMREGRWEFKSGCLGVCGGE